MQLLRALLILHLLHMGNYPAAEGAYEEALRLREAALEPDHPDVAESSTA